MMGKSSLSDYSPTSSGAFVCLKCGTHFLNRDTLAMHVMENARDGDCQQHNNNTTTTNTTTTTSTTSATPTTATTFANTLTNNLSIDPCRSTRISPTKLTKHPPGIDSQPTALDCTINKSDDPFALYDGKSNRDYLTALMSPPMMSTYAQSLLQSLLGSIPMSQWYRGVHAAHTLSQQHCQSTGTTSFSVPDVNVDKFDGGIPSVRLIGHRVSSSDEADQTTEERISTNHQGLKADNLSSARKHKFLVCRHSGCGNEDDDEEEVDQVPTMGKMTSSKQPTLGLTVDSKSGIQRQRCMIDPRRQRKSPVYKIHKRPERVNHTDFNRLRTNHVDASEPVEKSVGDYSSIIHTNRIQTDPHVIRTFGQRSASVPPDAVNHTMECTVVNNKVTVENIIPHKVEEDVEIRKFESSRISRHGPIDNGVNQRQSPCSKVNNHYPVNRIVSQPKRSINPDENHSNHYGPSERVTVERKKRTEPADPLTYSQLPYYCPHCEIGFQKQPLFSLHMGLHCVDETWKCNMCGKVCSGVYEFTAHTLHF